MLMFAVWSWFNLIPPFEMALMLNSTFCFTLQKCSHLHYKKIFLKHDKTECPYVVFYFFRTLFQVEEVLIKNVSIRIVLSGLYWEYLEIHYFTCG